MELMAFVAETGREFVYSGSIIKALENAVQLWLLHMIKLMDNTDKLTEAYHHYSQQMLGG